jgi:hypothetical protein
MLKDNLFVQPVQSLFEVLPQFGAQGTCSCDQPDRVVDPAQILAHRDKRGARFESD